MTQEEKVKAYDEAIERAKKWCNAPNVDKIPTFANKVIEELFPELKKSEDEKIKQRIIKLIKMSNEVGGYALHKWEADEMLAWVEKHSKNEQKYKPLFHEGDWVIGRVTENEPRQIIEITEKGYRTTHGGWIDFSFEKDLHRWTATKEQRDVLEKAMADAGYTFDFDKKEQKDIDQNPDNKLDPMK